MNRGIVTQEIMDKAHSIHAKYPRMTAREIAESLYGGGLTMKLLSSSTVNNMIRFKTIEEYHQYYFDKKQKKQSIQIELPSDTYSGTDDNEAKVTSVTLKESVEDLSTRVNYIHSLIMSINRNIISLTEIATELLAVWKK